MTYIRTITSPPEACLKLYICVYTPFVCVAFGARKIRDVIGKDADSSPIRRKISLVASKSDISDDALKYLMFCGV